MESPEEIDHADFHRVLLDTQLAPLTYNIQDLINWRAKHHQELGYPTVDPQQEIPPLVMRRELYRGLDENPYLHQDFWALYFVRRGHGTHVINGHAWSMARGNIYLLSPQSVHFYRGAANVVIDAIYFGENLFSGDERQALRELPGAAPLVASLNPNEAPTRPGHFLHLSPQRQLETEATIAQIRADLTQPQRAFHLSAKARLWCLIVQLAEWRVENTAPTRGGESRELADVVQFCETHFARPLTVEQLAAITHFSRNHFTRLFTLEVGMAPATYIRHLRLQHAQKLLTETLHSIADVAELCGFTDTTAFSRAFQKSFATSPGDYRKAHRRAPKHRPVTK